MFHVKYSESSAYGSVIRNVTCESCEGEYSYLLERRSVGYSVGTVVSSSQDLEEDAVDDAHAKLQGALALHHDAVPCPHCGWYQAHMIPVIRHEHRRGLHILGVFLLYPAFIVGLLDLNTGIALASVGIALILVRRVLASRLSPNEDDPHLRMEYGKSRMLSNKSGA